MAPDAAPQDPAPGAIGARPLGTLVYAGGLILGIGAVDYLTGTELRVYPLYFLPTALTSWRVGRWAGLAVAAASTFSWFLANRLAGLRFSSTTMTVSNTAMQLATFSLVAWLVSAYRHALETERRWARIDALTGLANARAFYERAEVERLRAQRSSAPLTVAYVDLDRFKELNDRAGHQAGDEVLASVGQVLGRRLRRTDVAAHIGGDEFAILLPETGAADATVVLESLRAGIAAVMEGRDLRVTATVGAAVFTSVPPATDAMLAEADHRMYQAKAAGRDRLAIGEVAGTPPPAPR